MIKLSEILKDTNDAAGIAYCYKGYLLCVRDNKGLWGIPKGHIQKGETPEQGAMREFTEETQIMLNRPIKFSHTSPKKKGKFLKAFKDSDCNVAESCRRIKISRW